MCSITASFSSCGPWRACISVPPAPNGVGMPPWRWRRITVSAAPKTVPRAKTTTTAYEREGDSAIVPSRVENGVEEEIARAAGSAGPEHHALERARRRGAVLPGDHQGARDDDGHAGEDGEARHRRPPRRRCRRGHTASARLRHQRWDRLDERLDRGRIVALGLAEGAPDVVALHRT